MLNKKIIALTIIFVSLFTVSVVSATDNVTGDIVNFDKSTDDFYVVSATGDATGNIVHANGEGEANNTHDNVLVVNDFKTDNVTNNQDILGSSESDNELSLDNDVEILSVKSPSSSDYKVSISAPTTSYDDNSGTITVNIVSPCTISGYYAYHFRFTVFNSNGGTGYSMVYQGTSSSPVKYIFDPKQYGVGTHKITVQNYAEPTIMATGTLTIKSGSNQNNPTNPSSTYPSGSAYSVSVSSSSMNYGSSGSISMSISPASSSTYKYYYYLKVYDSNNNEKISQVYYGTSAAYSKTYSVVANKLSVGTYTVKIINYADSKVMNTATLTVTGSTTKTTLTSPQTSYSSYYGTGFELNYEFTQGSDKSNVNSKIEIRIYTGNSYKSYYSTISKENMPNSFKLSSSMYVNCIDIAVGTHKLEAYIDGQYAFTKNLQIKKSSVGYDDLKTKTFKYKKNTYYKLEIWNKNTYDPVKNTYFKVKIYTGSKCKTYKIKTIMFESCSWLKIPTKNLKVGSHKVAISPYDNSYKGNFKSKIIIKSVKKTTNIKKTTTTKKVTKKSSNYVIITTNAKMSWITKKVGKYTVKTKIWDMTAGYMAPYKYIDTTLYKNGKQVQNTKYFVKYKINGKWTGWAKYGVISTAHHRHAVSDSASVDQIKVKVHK